MKWTKNTIKAFSAHYWPWFIILLVAIAFFIGTSRFNALSQTKDFVKWLSPDETANYTASKLYAETGSLAFFEKYNLVAKDIIHPRSFRSDWGLIKPVSFLGMPIFYGKIASWIGSASLPYLTPFFGALGLLFFYLLVKEIFGRSNALISTLLASVFPIYTYYSSRSMFHNVLFLSALIAGLYFAVKMSERNNEATSHFKKHTRGYVFALLSGLLVGLALTARTSELLWVGPLFFCLWLFNIRRIGVVRLFLFLYGIFTAFLPMLYWNNVLYGSFISSGYPELNSSLFSLTQDGSAIVTKATIGKFAELKSVFLNIKDTIFHFGFNLAQSHKMFNAYVRNMFPWLFWSTGVGVALFIAHVKEYKLKQWLFLLGWVLTSLILVVYYGSWVFFDNPDPRSFTIGNSYTRYWLPLYFGALPFVSLALIKATGFLRKQWLMWPIRIIAIIYIAFISIQFVWLDSSEGLKVSIEKQAVAKTEWQKVLALTERNSLIITRYHDKLLFPERKVLIGTFEDKNMIAEYANLAGRLPVYYYNFSFKDEDLAYLNSGPLKKVGIKITFVEKITDRFSLYRLSPLSLTLER